MQLAPHRAIPASLAVLASTGPSPVALPNTTAAPSPRRAALVSSWVSAVSGTPSRTRSTGSPRASRDGTQGRPSTSRWCGCTRCTGAALAGLRSASVARRSPKLPGRGARTDHRDGAGFQQRPKAGRLCDVDRPIHAYS